MPSSFALGNSMENFVNELVSQGRYNSKSEVVRVALRLLQERETLRQVKLDEVRRAFQEGINSGTGNSAETVLDRLEQKYSNLANGT
jgi:antitoxin ParD1/3/4